jgi:hypothetical protein
MDNAHIKIPSAVMESAEHGARSITSVINLIQDARNEVGLCYELRRAKGDPPLDHKGWAFICDKNYVIRNINIGRRDIELSNSIADSLVDSTEEARRPSGWTPPPPLRQSGTSSPSPSRSSRRRETRSTSASWSFTTTSIRLFPKSPRNCACPRIASASAGLDCFSQ